MTNAVRIERLSDDEDVDITDDPSEGEGEDIKSEFSGPPEADASAERPTEEQKEPTVLESISETKDQPCLSSPPQQIPPSTFKVICSEEDEKTASDEKDVKTHYAEIESQAHSKLTTGPSNDQSSNCDASTLTGQLMEGCQDSTGNPRRGFVCVSAS